MNTGIRAFAADRHSGARGSGGRPGALAIFRSTTFFGSAGSLLMSCSLPMSGSAWSPGGGPCHVTLTLNTAGVSGSGQHRSRGTDYPIARRVVIRARWSAVRVALYCKAASESATCSISLRSEEDARMSDGATPPSMAAMGVSVQRTVHSARLPAPMGAYGPWFSISS